MSCKTPVVFIVFRRPDLARSVFERIREVKPPKLFVLADGPRNETDVSLCEQARAVTEAVDWPCEVIRDYAEANMGSRRRISRGLDMVFEQEAAAIILEDDCLPHPSFFGFCDELLERYRDDERIWHIGGSNFQRGQRRGDGSYYFSNNNHEWGWATWRRAWTHYDHEMEKWPAFRDGNYLESLLDDPVEVKYWHGIFEKLYAEGIPDAWDYIWKMTCWMNRGLTILPNVNLVENTGFGADATNTTGGGWLADRRAEEISFPLKHPTFVSREREADLYTFEYVYPGRRLHMEQDWKYRLRRDFWRFRQRLMGRPVKS